MDLTKKIEVAVEVIRFGRAGVNVPAFIVRSLSEPHINKPNTSISSAPFLLSRATEPYRRLFEEAPRTKLEHGKMLAMLKRAWEMPCIECGGSSHSGQWDSDYLTLIAEIEGGAQ